MRCRIPRIWSGQWSRSNASTAAVLVKPVALATRLIVAMTTGWQSAMPCLDLDPNSVDIHLEFGLARKDHNPKARRASEGAELSHIHLFHGPRPLLDECEP